MASFAPVLWGPLPAAANIALGAEASAGQLAGEEEPVQFVSSSAKLEAGIVGPVNGGHDRTSLEDVLAEYLPERSKPNQIQVKLRRWLEWKRRETDAGDLSPTTLREYRRYCRPDGHLGFWRGLSVAEVRPATLQDWSAWLIDRGLSAKTRKNVMGAFHAFLSYLHDREELHRVPRFPWPRVPEHSPKILAPDAQDAVLEAISEDRRGPFYAMADIWACVPAKSARSTWPTSTSTRVGSTSPAR